MKRERITLCAIAVGSLCMPAMAQSICNGGTDCPDVLITPISATGSFNDLSDPDNLEITIGNSFLVEINLDGTSFPAADVVAVQLQLDIIGGAGLNCDDFTVDRTRGDIVIRTCTACAAVCGPPHVAGLDDHDDGLEVDFLAYIAEMTLTCKGTGSFSLAFGGNQANSAIYHWPSGQAFINIINDPSHFESINVECVKAPCGNEVLDSGFGEECDYAMFLECVTGPDGGPVTEECRTFDFDDDNDVDLIDWGGFQVAFTGKEPPAGMVFIPGGEFKMGDPWSEGETHEQPVHTVYLSPYHIDKYEVTNKKYAAALNWAYAQGGLINVISGVVYKHGGLTTSPFCDTNSADPESRIHWDDVTFSVTPGKEAHPVSEVSWYGSAAFCNWRSAMEGKPLCYELFTWTCDFSVAGYRLPTEAEWEKAAGWDQARQEYFRFGEHTDGCGYNCLDSQRANYWSSGDPFDTGAFPRTTPVGYYDGANHGGYQTQDAQSYYGCYDMSGNVWEWCNDRYLSTYYSSSPESNPTGATTGSSYILRGGGWNKFPHLSRSANRDFHSPGGREFYNGFRCATGIP